MTLKRWKLFLKFRRQILTLNYFLTLIITTIKTYIDLYIIFMCIYFSVCKVGIVSHSVVTAHPSPVLSIVRDSCLADWGCWVSFLLMESKHLLCVPFKSTTLLCLPVQLSQSEASRNTPALTKQTLWVVQAIHIVKSEQKYS